MTDREQQVVPLPDALTLNDGATLVREGVHWSLCREGGHIRYLDRFEREFIRAALVYGNARANKLYTAREEAHDKITRLEERLRILELYMETHAAWRHFDEWVQQTNEVRAAAEIAKATGSAAPGNEEKKHE